MHYYKLWHSDNCIAWRRVWLFDGAAVSAFFALVLVIIGVVRTCPNAAVCPPREASIAMTLLCAAQLFAIRYMIFSRRNLSHPRASFGKVDAPSNA